MKTKINCLLALACLIYLYSPAASFAQEPNLTEDSKRQPGVPEGEVKGPFTWQSGIYPGTEREYWLYVPQQYAAAKPVCVMVVQDGLGRANEWRLPIVLDNLIHKKEVPVTIGIFVQWGGVAADSEDAFQRFNRSFEYDALGDRYARFLIEELLPEVGKSYNLSGDPNDRLLAGASSGAICAFNAAFERPDAFRRVLSTIGTYVGLRGADELSTLVRKMEARPLRVFLQDGNTDLNIYAGDWWHANLLMNSALEWAGYEVNHAWGEGGHNGRHGAEIMPDALRWLWQGYPEPVKNKGADERRTDLLVDGEDWQPAGEGYQNISDIAANAKGELFFCDLETETLYKTGLDGKTGKYAEDLAAASLSFAPDGRLYAAVPARRQVVALAEDGTRSVVAENITCDEIVVSKQGLFFVDRSGGKVGRLDLETKEVNTYSDVKTPGCLALTAEQTFLNVGDSGGVFGWSYRIGKDGALGFGQRYIHYHVPYGEPSTAASDMALDEANRLYTVTNFGIQVADQLGRIQFIFASPLHADFQTLTFGGSGFDTLYAAGKDKIYKRKVKTKGIFSWSEPLKPPRPRL